MIAGGKYTTYRVMAKDAVDAAVRDLDQKVPPSCTEDVPLLGADGYHGAVERPRSCSPARPACGEPQVEHLLNRYGSLLPELLELIAESPELANPLDGAPEYLKVEAVYAASHEGALHLDDILARRTRISIETWDRGLGAAAEVAGLVAPVLGWGQADDRSGDRALPASGGRRARVAGPARRPVCRRRPAWSPGRPDGCFPGLGPALRRLSSGAWTRRVSATHREDDLGMNSTPDRIGDLVCAYLSEQCTVIIDSEPALRAGENVVHTTRVAVRRLRSTLRVFDDLFDEAQAQQLEQSWSGGRDCSGRCATWTSCR